jgi:negative regulator of sigma E activity
MTDQINDQISAFIDNELSADESALLVRRFERDTEARTRAMRYTLIGASLRGELLEPHPSVLRQRLAAALSGGTTPSSTPKARERWTDRWSRPLLGVGIAATVAVVAVGTLRSLNEAAFAPGNVAPVAGVPLQVSDPVNAPIYVVPPDSDPEQSRTVAPRLANYLMHHGEFASGLTRTSVNSNVVGAVMEPVATDATSVSKPVVDKGLE